ncbi:hypothetical protein AX15_003506 [Amanita polypyramis BW_CC]|nr:hypothetical protein AX15_003506 [Amanita polypyramis BW_CC]
MVYECANCNRSFETTQGVQSHCNVKRHSMYECTLCSGVKIFKNERAFQNHHRAVHLTFCRQCNRSFCDEQALSRHYRDSRVHNPLPQCRQCNRQFVNSAALDQHLRSSLAHRPISKCYQCDRVFSDEMALSQHVYARHRTPTYYCHQCTKVFADEFALNQHLRDSPAHKQVLRVVSYTSRDSNTYCHICEKEFSTPSDLQRHNASPVHRPRVIDCFVCPSSFKTPSALAHHMESSCRNLPFNRHEVTSVIQGLNIIPSISLRSAIEGPGVAARPLITYRATGTSFNGNGYQCHICSRTFHSLYSLDAHLNSPAHDENEFKCPKCNTQFKLISCLIQHLESKSCGLSSIEGVERRFRRITAQFSRALML